MINGGAGAAYAVKENGTAIATISASDPDLGNVLHFALDVGADAALFAIDPDSGVLRFVNARDFEVRADADHNNVYQVFVRASDGQASDVQTVDVTVGNVGGVRIVCGKANDTVNAARSVHGQGSRPMRRTPSSAPAATTSFPRLAAMTSSTAARATTSSRGDAGNDV